MALCKAVLESFTQILWNNHSSFVLDGLCGPLVICFALFANIALYHLSHAGNDFAKPRA